MTLPGHIAENVPLAPLTTFRAGGPARFLSRPADEGEVAEAIAFARARSLPVLVLGGGSNLLVADGGVEAVVVALSDAGEFGKINIGEDGLWRVGAAVSLSALVAATVREGRAGLCALSGIPGRVGGAVAMNAGGGADAPSMGDVVREALAYALDGGRRVFAPSFAYRRSDLGGMIALSFLLRFSGTEEPERLAASARAFREHKAATQPLGLPSAGCVFRNPPGASAGKLLDGAGCKGMAEGGARVSERHANFIVAGGGAKSGDIARLAARMRERVRERAGVRLEPEIRLWGEDPCFDALERCSALQSVISQGARRERGEEQA